APLCLRFAQHLTMSPARLEARMDSLCSFPVGLSHPLQHAGLSRRSTYNRVVGKVALCQKQARPSFRITDYSGTRAIPAKLRLTFPTNGFCSTFSLDSRVIQSVDPDT